MEKAPIEAVLERHTEALLAISGVVGTALGEHGGRPCIRVYVEQDSPALRARLPAELEGHPVVVQDSGPIQARD